jgi:release factor glutamine methyltransferase
VPSSVFTTYHDLNTTLVSTLDAVTTSHLQAKAEAAIIAQTVFGLSQAMLLTHPDRPLPAQQLQVLQSVLQRRLGERIPIQYLFAQAHFYGLSLHVSPSVLIPRPETELLVERILVVIQQGATSVLELGTGSGAVIIAVAKWIQANPTLEQTVRLTATDLCPQALSVARYNAKQLGVSHLITFMQGDLFDPVAEQTFDCIAWNPPYIDEALKPTLTPEVLNHEPAMALFADNHGLACYQRLAQTAIPYLHPTGTVLIEIGDDMGPAITGCFKDAGWGKPTGLFEDGAGVARVLQFSKP